MMTIILIKPERKFGIRFITEGKNAKSRLKFQWDITTRRQVYRHKKPQSVRTREINITKKKKKKQVWCGDKSLRPYSLPQPP